jgi:TRAP-type transport system periplasmic protein
MKRRIAAFCLAAVLAGFGVAEIRPAAAQNVRFTFATTNGPNDFSSQAILRWRDALRERSGGQIQMTFLSGGSLGGDQQLLQQLATNEIQMHVAGPVIVHSLLQQYQCLEGEFVYDNEAHGLKVWRGALGEEVKRELETRYGITIVGIGARGARHLTTNKPVRAPADLAGVKVRVTNPLRGQVFQAMGALPGTLSVAELYGGLRAGVFDAQENPIPTIWGNKFFEVQRYLVLTGHVQSFNVVTANKRFVDGLSRRHRTIFDETFAEAMRWLDEKVAGESDELVGRMKAAGLQVIEPDIAAFRAVAKPVVERFAAANCRPGLLADIDKAR